MEKASKVFLGAVRFAEPCSDLDLIEPQVGDPIDEESPIEGVVVDWPEKALEKPAGDNLKQQKPRRVGRCCSRRCWALSTCCGLSMVASIICTPLLWPKDPEWKLVDLEIVNRDDMMFFVTWWPWGRDLGNCGMARHDFVSE